MMELGEDPRVERGSKVHVLELVAAIGADNEHELIGGSEGLSLVEVSASIVGVGGEVEHDDTGGGDALDLAVHSPPRVLDDESAKEGRRTFTIDLKRNSKVTLSI
jgi:hypothetical protein